MAETLMDQSKPNDANAEFDSILKSSVLEAEDGKRMVRFFQIRRLYLAGVGGSPAELERGTGAATGSANTATRSGRLGDDRRYYRVLLQLQAELALAAAQRRKPQVIPQNVGPCSWNQKLYRTLSQSDNDYTHERRATECSSSANYSATPT